MKTERIMRKINWALGQKINERLKMANDEPAEGSGYRVQVLVIGGQEARTMVTGAIDTDHSVMQCVSTLESAVDEFQRGNLPDIIVLDQAIGKTSLIEFLVGAGIDALIPVIEVQSESRKPEIRDLKSMIRELSPAFVFA